jgi:hypothetical protein
MVNSCEHANENLGSIKGGGNLTGRVTIRPSRRTLDHGDAVTCQHILTQVYEAWGPCRRVESPPIEGE